MSRCLLTIIISFSFINSFSQEKVRFEITSLPPGHDPNSSIYLAGSFNGWNPQNKNFQFTNNNGSYSIEVPLNPGTYEFKITRGGWDKVECGKNGNDLGNRVVKTNETTKVEIQVEGWKDNFGRLPVQHTANTNVHILDTAFFIPQLQRYRRVWVYLPPGYENSGKKYPVLYMHDGQNVFDAATSYAGEWGVDECLDSMTSKVGGAIVVAVDNGLNKRLNEYSPYDFNLSGIATNYESNKGEGAQYVDFLAKTLKPFIDKKYRTKKDRKNTFIAGSSMGGLISLYAQLRYPKVYGGAGVFSPAFWVAPGIYDDIRTKGKKVKAKIYFYAGVPESETMAPNTLKALEEMKKVSKSKMEAVIRAEGLHNEPRWRIEFPLFYQWIMK